MTDFRVGDLVRCNTSDYKYLKKDKCYKVIQVVENGRGDAYTLVLDHIDDQCDYPSINQLHYNAQNFSLAKRNRPLMTPSDGKPVRFIVMDPSVYYFLNEEEMNAHITKKLSQNPTLEIHIYEYSKTATAPPVSVIYTNKHEPLVTPPPPFADI